MFVDRRSGAALVAAAALALPGAALACACGCGVFDVGDATLIPGGAGGSAWLEGDFLDQTRNWSGASRADPAGDPDKRITTEFVTLGAQYMTRSGFGVMAEMPFAERSFTTIDDGVLHKFRHFGAGDLRVSGVWSGLSPDMSTGLTLGLKLPTGSFTQSGFDRDVQLGSGTTDLLVGGYHLGALNKTATWNWFAQATWDHPLNMRAGYRPGDEVDAAAGLAWAASPPTAKVGFTPMFQLLASHRGVDAGPRADPPNTGYTRLLLAPGVEVKAGKWKLYGDVEVPFYQFVRGQQLVAPVQGKLILSRAF
jgi:hypothetical protein